MRLIVKHPLKKKGVFAYIGCDPDPAIGWFCSVLQKSKIEGQDDKVLATYDSMTIGEPSTLKGAVDVLQGHGFFQAEALNSALELLFIGDDGSSAKPAVKRVAKLICDLKRGAAE